MQIKEHPKGSGKFQFLRYEPVKVAGKVVRSGQKVIKPEDFTPDERAQYDKWKADRGAAAAKDNKRFRALYAADTVAKIAEAIEEGFLPEGNGQQVLDALDRLNKALRKAHITRPPRVKQVAMDNRTGNLPLTP